MVGADSRGGGGGGVIIPNVCALTFEILEKIRIDREQVHSLSIL